MKTFVSAVKALVLIFCINLFLWTGCEAFSAEDKLIHMVFRFDDYSALSSTETELRIIDEFRKIGGVVTFGVIPFVCDGDIHDPSPMTLVPLPSEKGDILKRGLEAGVLDIALHGYAHQTNDPGRMKEFSGLDYAAQLQKMARGKQFLEAMTDRAVIAFVPPWNQYDSNTLKALARAGFATLSADVHGDMPEGANLTFLPATSSLNRLQDSVLDARASSNPAPLIVILFHAYDFKEIDQRRGKVTYQEFSSLLAWLKSQEDIRLLSIDRAAELMRMR